MIIPEPGKIKYLSGTFEMTGNASIKASEDLIVKAEQLRDYFSPASGFFFRLKVEKQVEI